jgi:hypothetical protein
MISPEECKYYRWLGRFFTGAGAVVELGPWLGCSTVHILAGLERSPGFSDRRLHVFDDFVWRSSWMDRHLPATPPPADGACFQPLFERNMGPLLARLVVTRRRLGAGDPAHPLPPLVWSDGPIELVYVDCGRTFEVNEAWYAALAPSFIPGTTVVVMQDWQTHKETPVQPYNETKRFTDAKGGALELIHELRSGQVGTFLFRG